MRKLLVACLILALAALPARAQNPSFPQILPQNTVIGYIGAGTSGPAAAIPLSTLGPLMAATMVTGSQLLITNAGTFTTLLAQNDTAIVNIGSLNIGSQYSGQQGGNFALEGMVGACAIPAAATVAACNAVAGYATNGANYVGKPGGAIGGYFQGVATANGGQVWGGNTLAADVASLTTGQLVTSLETDLNVHSTTSVAQNIVANTVFFAQSTNSVGLVIASTQSGCPGCSYQYGIDLAQGTTHPLNAAIRMPNGGNGLSARNSANNADVLLITESSSNFTTIGQGSAGILLGTSATTILSQGNLNPNTDNTYTLGANGTRWSQVYGVTYFGGSNVSGVTCPTGSPTSSFATAGGIVTHC